jgi:pimeloyl-ACP methyl ester carboxylesterase
VVFDAALGASSVSWSLVLPEVSAVTRACAYDRAGFGWSDAGPMPRTTGRIAAELRELLHRAEVSPPYLLVGHSFGALVTRVFAARYRAETAGLILVDPAHPEEWVEPSDAARRQIERGARLCRQGRVAARLGIARLVAALAAVGALAPARGVVRIVSRGGLGREEESILAPMWKLPPEARRPLRRFWTQPKFYDALGSQIASICESAREVASAGAAAYGDLPLVTIASSTSSPERMRCHEGVARLSRRGRHIVAPDSGHWIPLDRPSVVIEAILQMVAELRGR